MRPLTENRTSDQCTVRTIQKAGVNSTTPGALTSKTAAINLGLSRSKKEKQTGKSRHSDTAGKRLLHPC